MDYKVNNKQDQKALAEYERVHIPLIKKYAVHLACVARNFGWQP